MIKLTAKFDGVPMSSSVILNPVKGECGDPIYDLANFSGALNIIFNRAYKAKVEKVEIFSNSKNLIDIVNENYAKYGKSLLDLLFENIFDQKFQKYISVIFGNIFNFKQKMSYCELSSFLENNSIEEVVTHLGYDSTLINNVQSKAIVPNTNVQSKAIVSNTNKTVDRRQEKIVENYALTPDQIFSKEKLVDQPGVIKVRETRPVMEELQGKSPNKKQEVPVIPLSPINKNDEITTYLHDFNTDNSFVQVYNIKDLFVDPTYHITPIDNTILDKDLFVKTSCCISMIRAMVQNSSIIDKNFKPDFQVKEYANGNLIIMSEHIGACLNAIYLNDERKMLLKISNNNMKYIKFDGTRQNWENLLLQPKVS